MTAEEVKTKVCKRCGEKKDISYFRKNTNECKQCFSAKRREYYKANVTKEKELNKLWRKANVDIIKNKTRIWKKENREKIRAADKKWRDSNKDKVKEMKKRWRDSNKDKVRDMDFRRNFKNMSLERYNDILVEQNYCCVICNTPESKLSRRLAVDHCHISGEVRGLICNNCNRGLGYYKDSVVLLKSAIKYLEDFEKTLTQQSQSDTINIQE